MSAPSYTLWVSPYLCQSRAGEGNVRHCCSLQLLIWQARDLLSQGKDILASGYVRVLDVLGEDTSGSDGEETEDLCFFGEAIDKDVALNKTKIIQCDSVTHCDMRLDEASR